MFKDSKLWWQKFQMESGAPRTNVARASQPTGSVSGWMVRVKIEAGRRKRSGPNQHAREGQKPAGGVAGGASARVVKVVSGAAISSFRIEAKERRLPDDGERQFVARCGFFRGVFARCDLA